MQQLYAIPAELRALRQFVLWKYVDVGAAKPTKVPYQISGEKADVNNPFSWSSFEECFNALSLGGYDGLGFVFTSNDPYCVIDLDDTLGDTVAYERQLKIFNEFDSYSEISPSGRGLHVIVKGQVPTGRRRNFVEVYSSQRYITMTGNVYKNSPIYERQQLLDQLYAQMGGPPKVHTYTGNDPQREEDAIIIQRARNASNGDRFAALDDGQWVGSYPSQSEADFAYIDMLAFYTQNRAQIERMFRASKLMRPKVNDNKGYLPEMINRSFDRLTPLMDFDGFRIALEEKLANKAEAPIKANELPEASTIPLPPGLLGEIASFIYAASPRPVPEIAMAGAIGLMSGICGKAYNVSGTGLNQYILLLAKTGRGKDSITSGIDKIMMEVKKTVPVAGEFIGPEIINSGQALTRYMSQVSSCFVSVLGEFGFTIERISDPRANAADKMLYSNLLSIYSRSGYGQVFKSSIYAKKEDSVNATDSPSVTILGESNPTTFYEAIDETMILAGLLPRFLMIEYEGERKYLNESAGGVRPDPGLIERIGSLAAHCKEIMHRRTVSNIKLSEDAKDMMRIYDKKTTDIINTIANPAIDELWNRAHLKVLKLASVVAIGINPYNPIITKNEIDWALPIVERDIRSLAHKFDMGIIGKNSDEMKQLQDTMKIIREYLIKDDEYIKKYRGKTEFRAKKIICNTYLSDKLIRMASFRKSKFRGSDELKKVIQVFIDKGTLVEMTHQMKLKEGIVYAGKLYQILSLS